MVTRNADLHVATLIMLDDKPPEVPPGKKEENTSFMPQAFGKGRPPSSLLTRNVEKRYLR